MPINEALRKKFGFDPEPFNKADDMHGYLKNRNEAVNKAIKVLRTSGIRIEYFIL